MFISWPVVGAPISLRVLTIYLQSKPLKFSHYYCPYSYVRHCNPIITDTGTLSKILALLPALHAAAPALIGASIIVRTPKILCCSVVIVYWFVSALVASWNWHRLKVFIFSSPRKFPVSDSSNHLATRSRNHLPITTHRSLGKQPSIGQDSLLENLLWFGWVKVHLGTGIRCHHEMRK